MSGSVRVSQLPAVASLQATDELEVSQGGASRKATMAQISAGFTIAASQITDSTTAGRALLTAADAPAQRTALSINNVDNTSDANKPVSTAQQTALNGKAATTHSHAIADVTGLQTALDGKAATSHTHSSKDIAVVFFKTVTTGGGTAVIVPRPISEINISTTQVFKNGSREPSFSLIDDPFAPGVNTWVIVPSYTTGTTFEVADVITAPWGLLSAADRTKFDGIATGATANATNAQLRDRSTHTGSQAASTISDSTTAGRALLTAADVPAQRTALALGSADSPTFTAVSDSKGNLRDLPVTNRTAAYTAALSDTGGTIRITTGGVTIPSGVFSAGQAFSIANNSASNQTITQGAGVTMYLAGTGTTGNRTLAQRGLVVVSCMAPNEFIISGPGLT